MGGFALWSWGEIVYGCGARVAYAAGGAKAVVLPLNPRNQYCFGWQLTMSAASMHGPNVLPRDREALPLTHHPETAEVWTADGDQRNVPGATMAGGIMHLGLLW